jgi:hypothetical protein
MSACPSLLANQNAGLGEARRRRSSLITLQALEISD